MVSDTLCEVFEIQAAISHLRSFAVPKRAAYDPAPRIAVFRIGCLQIVKDRFGAAAAAQGLDAVARTLAALLPGDAIFRCGESSLTVICARSIDEDQFVAELRHILRQNRDFTIHVHERKIMLRLPVSVSVHSSIQSASDEELAALLRETTPGAMHTAPPQSNPAKGHHRTGHLPSDHALTGHALTGQVSTAPVLAGSARLNHARTDQGASNAVPTHPAEDNQAANTIAENNKFRLDRIGSLSAKAIRPDRIDMIDKIDGIDMIDRIDMIDMIDRIDRIDQTREGPAHSF